MRAALLVALAVAGLAAPLAPAPGARWAPQPGTPAAAVLLGVDCTAPSACVGVGAVTDAAGHVAAPLVEVARAGRWRVQQATEPRGAKVGNLVGVSCPGTRSCTAVGYYKSHAGTELPLAERWNGRRWSVQPVPAPSGAAGSGLGAVSCPTTRRCVAVGGYTTGAGTEDLVIERWNGSSWRVQQAPVPPVVPDTNLNAVSCSGPAACTAVGSAGSGTGDTAPIVERWNGTAWSLQANPFPAGAVAAVLFGVSCPTATSCTAAGLSQATSKPYQNLVEQWDGTSWTIAPAPDPAGTDGLNELHSVACSAADDCTAVGSQEGSNRRYRTVVERWNGTAWTVQASYTPAGPLSLVLLDGVSCPGPTSCTAVGFSYGRTKVPTALAVGE